VTAPALVEFLKEFEGMAAHRPVTPEEVDLPGLPALKNGKTTVHTIPQSPALHNYVGFLRSELERFAAMSGKEKRENSHIPLVVFGLAKKATLRPLQMSGGEKQGVAITRALHFEAELVILDEPTMGLSLSETKKTLDFVRSIKAAGKSAIFIDHNIFNIYPVVDRLYVLDRGKVAGVFNRADITMDQLIERLYHVARTGSMELPS